MVTDECCLCRRASIGLAVVLIGGRGGSGWTMDRWTEVDLFILSVSSAGSASEIGSRRVASGLRRTSRGLLESSLENEVVLMFGVGGCLGRDNLLVERS